MWCNVSQGCKVKLHVHTTRQKTPPSVSKCTDQTREARCVSCVAKKKNGDSLSRVFTLWVCRLPTVSWSFHPVLIGGKQRQARVASCSLEILYVQPLQGLEEGTLSPELAKNILSFSLEAEITLKKIRQVNRVGMPLLVNPGDYVYQLLSGASSW